jgi:hypothetical protein
MISNRIFVLNFLAISWFLLSGFEGKAVSIDNLKTAVSVESFESEQSQKILEKKHLKEKNASKILKVNPKIITPEKGTESLGTDNLIIERNEFDMPLDLSVPFKSAENSDYQIEQKELNQGGAADLFDLKTKKKPRSLELGGGLLMSPEPEAEKRKTVDGAGIVINLKP